MTTLQQQIQTTPTEGTGRHDAETEPRFSPDAFLRTIRDTSDFLRHQADELEGNGKQPELPVDQHEAERREAEAIAATGKPESGEVETMTVEKEFDEIRQDFVRELADRVLTDVPEPGTVFKGAVIEVPVCGVRGKRFEPSDPKANLEVDAANIPSFYAARQVAIAMNRESIKSGKLSRAVVMRRRAGKGGQKYGVVKLPTGIPVKSKNPIQDHPAIRFDELEWSVALARASAH